MSDLRVNTISDAAGTGPVELTKQWAAKGYVDYNQTTGPSIDGSENISSVTDSSAGVFVVNFTNAMANGNYAATGISQQPICQISGSSAPSTTTCAHVTRQSAFTATDGDDNKCIYLGDLA